MGKSTWLRLPAPRPHRRRHADQPADRGAIVFSDSVCAGRSVDVLSGSVSVSADNGVAALSAKVCVR